MLLPCHRGPQSQSSFVLYSLDLSIDPLAQQQTCTCNVDIGGDHAGKCTSTVSIDSAQGAICQS